MFKHVSILGEGIMLVELYKLIIFGSYFNISTLNKETLALRSSIFLVGHRLVLNGPLFQHLPYNHCKI